MNDENEHAQHIPDGLILRDSKGRLIRVYNPAWWRLDRHVFWFFKRVFNLGGGRGHAVFSAVITTAAGETHVEDFALPVYEIDASAGE